jgi:hypothetical protein
MNEIAKIPAPLRGYLGLFGATVCVSLATSCIDTGQEQVEIPLYLAGTNVTEPVSAVGDLAVTIERADLAFGPLYLCAGNTAGDLCETARLEWLESAVVDTLNDDAMAVGSMSGVTGSVRSWMYDLGISSQLTRPEPYILEAARDLGNASFVLEGSVLISEVNLPFSAKVAIQQEDTNELGIPVIRKGSETKFFHEVTGTEHRLTLRFDASAWVSRIDFFPFLEVATCDTSHATIVCDGQVELTCDSDASLVGSRECSALEQVCIKGQGCVDELILEEGSETYRSLAIALTTTGRPTFRWTE